MTTVKKHFILIVINLKLKEYQRVTGFARYDSYIWNDSYDSYIQMCAMKQKQASSPVKKRRRVVEEEEIDGVFISDRPRKRAKVNYAE